MKTFRSLCIFVVSLVVSSCDSDDAGGESADTGRNADGFSLTDVDPFAERWLVEPTSITFSETEQGVDEIVGLRVTNGSTSSYEIRDLQLLEADGQVRFTQSFVVDLGRRFAWADIDGDGQDFESHDTGIPLGPGESFELSLVHRPDGRLSECLDPAPAACGFFAVSGPEVTVSIPLFMPR